MEGGIPSLLLTTPDDSGVRCEKNLISLKKQWEEGRAMRSHKMETQVSTDLTPQAEC